MSYIGNQPQYTSFLSDIFSGNGSTTVYTMAVAPSNTAAVIVAIFGILQDPTTYGVVGRILTFSQAPPTGTGNISVRYLALPSSNVVSTAYRSVSEFTATAGQTTFTPASYTPGFINVFRSGVRLGAANFTATNGVTVVLTNAAAAGDLITIESFFVSSVLNAIPAVPGQITPALLDSTSQSGVGALLLPSGTTAQRPAVPQVGMQRWNTSLGVMEVFVGGGTWQNIASTSYAFDFLIIAGGGGGGHGTNNPQFAGGGAGGVVQGAGISINPGTVLNIIVGAGGPANGGGAGGTAAGGANSSLTGQTVAIGGGGGGGGGGSGGFVGGSGGGQGGTGAPSLTQFRAPGTAGQGNAGGAGVNNSTDAAGGGGGFGGVGQDGTNSVAGNGGAGLTSSISGTTTSYAGGGGRTDQGFRAGFLGSPNGVANSGSGGAGSAGAGGSGIVIIRYAGSVQRASGGNLVNIAGGFVSHIFTSSGSFTA